jgi:MoxR-like ATPase
MQILFSLQQRAELIRAAKADVVGLLQADDSVACWAPSLLRIAFDLSDDESELLTARFSSTLTGERPMDITDVPRVAPYFSVDVDATRDGKRSRGCPITTMDQLRTVADGMDGLGVDIQSLRSAVLKGTPGAGLESQVVPSTSRLVLTRTTREHLAQVIEAAENPIPLLLHGGTGCGKSACVLEAAARRKGTTCVRLNLSNRTTVDDLLGRVTMLGRTTFGFVKGLFTNAYEQGHWLLMDEINLAPDAVLQVIESALDSGVLELTDLLEAGGQGKTVTRHPDFRLFATANPGVGFFKNKREVLSTSLLSRFVPIVFHDLPAEECVEVVQHRLQSLAFQEADSRAWAEAIVHFHGQYLKAIDSESPQFVERSAYAHASIRELLKFVDHIGWFVSRGGWSREPGVNDMKRAVVSLVAWSVYGARFRSGGDACVRDLIVRAGWPSPLSLQSQSEIEWWITDTEVVIAGVRVGRIRRELGQELKNLFMPSSVGNVGLETAVLDVRIHMCEVLLTEAMKIAWSQLFVSAYGCYSLEPAWLSPLATMSFDIVNNVEFTRLAVYTIVARFRHTVARSIMRVELLKAARRSGVEVREDDVLEDVAAQPASKSLSSSERPFIVTPRVLQFWASLMLALHVDGPILVVGESGCGKSECVRVLARLLGYPAQQVLITPDSEVSDLVGHLNPTDAGHGFQWTDGPITSAFSTGAGQWCFLENLSEADPCVAERLNPLLETPSTWVVSERGDVRPLPLQPNFRVIATMSIGGRPTSSRDLSPALANRFSTVVLNSQVTRRELEAIVSIVLGDGNQDASAAAGLVVSFFCEVWLRETQGGEPPHEVESSSDLSGDLVVGTTQLALDLTLRNFVRTVDCLHKLVCLLSAGEPTVSHSKLVAGALFVSVRGHLDSTRRVQVGLQP